MRTKRCNLIAWTGSFLFHATAIIALGVLAPLASSTQGTSLVLTAELPDFDQYIDLEVLAPKPTLEAPAVESSASLASLGGDLLVEDSASLLDAPDLAAWDAAQKDSRFSDDQFSQDWAGRGGDGYGDGQVAEFFGLRAGGQRFVYVVDCSTSMRGRRWSEATKELIRSLESLAHDQEFYVICFAQEAIPLPPARGRSKKMTMLDASPRNIKRVQGWVRSLDLGYDTRPKSAMQMALELKPDAVFLLSDGELRDNTLWYLRETNSQAYAPIPIHTVGLQSLSAQETLKVIAEESRGKFRFLSLQGDEDLVE